MKCLAEVYQLSKRIYPGLPDIDYPLHDRGIVVTRCGRICLGKKKQFQRGLRRASRATTKSAGCGASASLDSRNATEARGSTHGGQIVVPNANHGSRTVHEVVMEVRGLIS